MRASSSLCAALAATFTATLAFAQGMGPTGSGPLPQPVTLTTKDVERLIQVLPEVAKEGAKFNKKLAPGQAPDPEKAQGSEEMKHIESLLAQKGLTMTDFAVQMATLVSTYLALSPEALDEQMPSEKHPEVQKILNDPAVPAEQKSALKQQIKMAQENKELIRAQLTQFATEENKKVVKPLLPKVKKALDEAQAQSKNLGAPRR